MLMKSTSSGKPFTGEIIFKKLSTVITDSGKICHFSTVSKHMHDTTKLWLYNIFSFPK